MKDKCYLVKAPRIGVVFIYSPVAGGPYLKDYPTRFVSSYQTHLTKVEHECVVVCNGVRVSDEIRQLFAPLHRVSFLEHDDSGWDIGGYQAAARRSACDLMVFFGGTSYLRCPEWLDLALESYCRNGPAIYGTMGNTGIGDIRPHIRTTCFWMPRDLFNEYPRRIVVPDQRYLFEHGPQNLTQWTLDRGLKAWVITRFGEYALHQSNLCPNGFMHADQAALIAGDRMSCPPFYPIP